jgi:hypothetical protein
MKQTHTIMQNAETIKLNIPQPKPFGSTITEIQKVKGKDLKSIVDLVNRQDLTDLEKKVVIITANFLETWIGVEDYSYLSFKELCALCNNDSEDGFNISMQSLKGVVGSLCKKDILYTYEREADEYRTHSKAARQEVGFVNQSQMER